METIEITSPDESRIGIFRDVRDAELRGGGGRSKRAAPTRKLAMVESAAVIARLLESPWRQRTRALLLSHEALEALRDDLERRLPAAAPVYVTSEAMLREIAGYRHPGGALAAIERPAADQRAASALIADVCAPAGRAAVLLLERITNIDNLGLIFRNAAAFGVRAVLLHGCADALFRKAIRVSMGHVFNVPWAQCADLAAAAAELRSGHGYTVIAAESAREGGAPLRPERLPRRAAIIFGNERHGLSPGVQNSSDSMLHIPMAAGVQSINVAVAAGVFLHAHAAPPELR